MIGLQITLRVIHILCGAFWVGALVFNAAFLVPAMGEAGPGGAAVGAALLRRGFATVLPVMAVLTLLSGLWLYSRASFGFQSVYLGSGPGMAYGIGGAIAVGAFAYALAVARPAMIRSMALGQAPAEAEPAVRERQLAEAQAVRARAAKAGNIVAAALVVATVLMAVARYA